MVGKLVEDLELHGAGLGVEGVHLELVLALEINASVALALIKKALRAHSLSYSNTYFNTSLVLPVSTLTSYQYKVFMFSQAI